MTLYNTWCAQVPSGLANLNIVFNQIDMASAAPHISCLHCHSLCLSIPCPSPQHLTPHQMLLFWSNSVSLLIALGGVCCHGYLHPPPSAVLLLWCVCVHACSLTITCTCRCHYYCCYHCQGGWEARHENVWHGCLTTFR
jgi:hypothetical protein